MGDALRTVQLGKERKVEEVIAGGYHTCARFDDGKVACWGENHMGGLGLGLTTAIIAATHAAKWAMRCRWSISGTDYAAAQLAASWTHTCASFATGALKCWGDNDVGLLGLGDIEPRGDSAAEMGDALPEVDLGGMSVEELVVGDYHNCARLENERIKCWGANVFSGEDQARGNDPNEMGDALPFVELGTDLTVKALGSGGYHMCALLSDERVKCWGDNEHGELGQGDSTVSRPLASEMGDALRAADLGKELRVVQLVGGTVHNCALFEDGRVKCWGDNSRGQLGAGDTEWRGDEPAEMGDALPFVDLGRGVRASPTHEPGEPHLRAPGGRGAEMLGRERPRPARSGQAGDDRGDSPTKWATPSPRSTSGRPLVSFR